jgi:outer membrane lipopolysaccharide assembly protein LptE/RlpB
MKKQLTTALLVTTSLFLTACNTTVEVEYPEYEDVNRQIEWEIDPETGSWQASENQVFKTTIKKKEYELPTQQKTEN